MALKLKRIKFKKQKIENIKFISELNPDLIITTTNDTKINVKGGYIDASAPKGLLGANIKFPFISVGATESIIIAAVLAKGVTKIVKYHFVLLQWVCL